MAVVTITGMTIDELLDEATKPDSPYGYPCDALAARVGPDDHRLTLADTNAAFAYAKSNPMAFNMWAFNGYADWFAALIDLSEGKLFWAEDEGATELSPQDLSALGRALEDDNGRAKFISLVDFLFYENHGTTPNGYLQPYNWLTTDVPASAIKPARS